LSFSAVMSSDGGDLDALDNVIEIDCQSDRSNPRKRPAPVQLRPPPAKKKNLGGRKDNDI
jgi:hypothetical protein